MSILLLLLLFLQPKPDAAPPDAASVIAALRAAERAGPIADRIVVKVTPTGGREKRSTILFRFDPGDEATHRSQKMRIDLGPSRLAVSVADGKITAINHADPSTVFTADTDKSLTTDSLRKFFPPLPLPELAWTLGGEDAPWMEPYLRSPAWSAAEIKDNFIILNGSSPEGQVRLTVDRDSHRPRGLTLTPTSGPKIELQITPIDPGNAAGWSLSAEGRTPVASLSMLRPVRPEVLPGAKFTDIPLMTPDLAPLSFTQALKSDAAKPRDAREPAPVGVLILFRAGRDGVTIGTAEQDAHVATLATTFDSIPAEGDAPRPRLVVRLSGVVSGDQFDPDALAKKSAEWASAHAGSPDLLWCTSGWATIERYQPDASAVMLVIGADMKIMGTLSLEGRASDKPGIAEELKSILNVK